MSERSKGTAAVGSATRKAEVEAQRKATLDTYVKKVVAEFPPLTITQQATIVALLGPGSKDGDLEVRIAQQERRLKEEQAQRIAAEEKAKHEAEEARRAAAARCAVYRHFDADGVLLYVGMSSRTESRRVRHLRDAAWPRFQATETVEWLANRALAEAAEEKAITEEEPIFNIRGAADGARERRLRYLAAHEAWDLLKEAK